MQHISFRCNTDMMEDECFTFTILFMVHNKGFDVILIYWKMETIVFQMNPLYIC